MSTVFVVEDAAIVREPLHAALEAEGYSVRSIGDGTEAIQKLASQRPDLVLLDINLPGTDGLSILKHIRNTPNLASIPVIMLSAVAEKQRVVAAVQLGISAYMLKSRFSLSDMMEQVRKHLASPHQRMGQPSQPAPASTPFKSASQPPTNEIQPSPAPGPEIKSPESTDDMSSGSAQNGHNRSAIPPIDGHPDPVEALKSLKPLMPRSEINALLEDNAELKGLSPAVSQVLRLTGTDRCSIEQVAKAISQDHAIALKVLKLANSAVYTRGEPVDSVQLAVSRIGLGQIRQTVLNLSVIDQFNAQAACKRINFGQFWEHAIAVGFIAAELAHALEQDSDSAFTMGLLHDVGRMFFADQLGEMYDQVLEVANTLELPAEQVEARMLLYNHADIMDRVLHGWKFPKQLINPIVFHHLSAGNIRRSAPRQLTEVAMLGLANRLAHAMMLGSSGNETVYPTNEICAMLKLDPNVIQAIHDKARDETDTMKFALLATSNTANWPQLRQEHRNVIGESFCPLFVSESPKIDAYRIFCEELTTTPSEQPNIGVIHMSNIRERVPLTEAYRAAESAAGVQALPLLVLSPAGKILPESSLTDGRRVTSLATPFIIPKFLKAVRTLLDAEADSIPAQAA